MPLMGLSFWALWLSAYPYRAPNLQPATCSHHVAALQMSPQHLESAATLGIGTPEYMAPEMLLNPHQMGYLGATSRMSVSKDSGRESKQGYDAKKVDAWSVGVLLYVLVAAQYPFAVSGSELIRLSTWHHHCTAAKLFAA